MSVWLSVARVLVTALVTGTVTVVVSDTMPTEVLDDLSFMSVRHVIAPAPRDVPERLWVEAPDAPRCPDAPQRARCQHGGKMDYG